MSERADPKTKTVLIVDDDESMLNLLEVLVRRDGFNILLARDGERALLKLERKPDAIILDLMLPGGLSGFEMLRRLHDAPGPVPPIIVITAMSSSPELSRIQKDPLVHLFLMKPIRQEKLLGALHKALNTRPPLRPDEEPPPAEPEA